MERGMEFMEPLLQELGALGILGYVLWCLI
jgi:hypothetical protein